VLGGRGEGGCGLLGGRRCLSTLLFIGFAGDSGRGLEGFGEIGEDTWPGTLCCQVSCASPFSCKPPGAV
jgi:hypothetical protein